MPIHVMNNAARLTILEKRIKANEAELATCDPNLNSIRISCIQKRIARLTAEHKDLNSSPDQREE